MNHFDRLAQRAIGREETFGSRDDECQLEHPLLWRWLTSTDAGPEYVKDPAKLTIRASPDGFLVSLADECYGASLDVASATLAGCYVALEEELKKPNAAWRTWPNHKPRIRKRPKSS